eukprot:GEMP01002284.1.p1 GENE.GEMP01002284.1~~GEMP01002284.1.p1  ORF type:complete len:1017 (+),score=211.75 GEMP01002284.1:93-3143(+)
MRSGVPVDSSEADSKNGLAATKGTIADVATNSFRLTSASASTPTPTLKSRVSLSTNVSSCSGITRSSTSSDKQQPLQLDVPSTSVVSDIFTLQGEHLYGKGYYLWQRLPIWRFNSPFVRHWQIFLLLVSIWTFGWVPLSWSFDRRGRVSQMQLIYVFDRCLDAIYCMVPLVRMRTTVCDVNGGKEWAGPPIKIFWMAMKDRTFYLDLLSMLPIILDIFNRTNWKTPGTSWAPPLKLFRAHRILFIPTSHIEAEFCIYILLSRIFLWVFLISHLMACAWYSLVSASHTLHYHLDYNYLPTIDCFSRSSDLEHYSLKPDFYHSYHNEHINPTTAACQNSMDKIRLSTQYLLALREGVYIFLGRVRPAFSDAEMAFLGLLGPIGGLLLAVISAQSTVLLQRIDAVARKHHEHMTFIRGAMKSLRLPPDLTVRIESYHHFLAIHHDLNSYSSIFQGLSMQLFTELKAHIYNALFRTAPFFRNACKEFINYIVLALEEITCSPGDNVVTQGEIGHEMYWILRGRCEVVESLRVVAQLGENHFFGEIALLVQTPRLCTVRAATYCLLAMITRDHFLPIIEQFPEQKRLMVDRIQTYSMNNPMSSGLCEDENEGNIDNEEDADINAAVDEELCSEQNSTNGLDDPLVSLPPRSDQLIGSVNDTPPSHANMMSRSMSLGNLAPATRGATSTSVAPFRSPAMILPSQSPRTTAAVPEAWATRRLSRASHMSVDGDRHTRLTWRRDRNSMRRPTTLMDMTLENEVKRLGNEAVENRAMVVQFEDESNNISNSSVFMNAMTTLGERALAGFTRRSTISGANLSFHANRQRMSAITLQKSRTSMLASNSLAGCFKAAPNLHRSNSVYSITSSTIGDIGDNGFKCSHFATSKNNMLKDIKEQVEEIDDVQAEVAARVESIEHLVVDGFTRIWELLEKRLPPAATDDVPVGSKDDLPDVRKSEVEPAASGSLEGSKDDLPHCRKSEVEPNTSRQGSKAEVETSSRWSEEQPMLEVGTGTVNLPSSPSPPL